MYFNAFKINNNNLKKQMSKEKRLVKQEKSDKS